MCIVTGTSASAGWFPMQPAPNMSGTGRVAGAVTDQLCHAARSTTAHCDCMQQLPRLRAAPGAASGQVPGPRYSDRTGAATDQRACGATEEGQMPWPGISGSGPL